MRGPVGAPPTTSSTTPRHSQPILNLLPSLIPPLVLNSPGLPHHHPSPRLLIAPPSSAFPLSPNGRGGGMWIGLGSHHPCPHASTLGFWRTDPAL
eukprot:9475608-Pyramimonas_sp.AAC.2